MIGKKRNNAKAKPVMNVMAILRFLMKIKNA
jgi:hypothetical protein